MACDHPNIIVFSKILNADGTKKRVAFFRYDLLSNYDQVYNKLSKDTVEKYTLLKPYLKELNPDVRMPQEIGPYEICMIGCGECEGCRMEYSRQWAMRCSLEASLHEANYFVTLTYDEEHLPTNSYSVKFNKETGEITHDGYSHPLNSYHLRQFLTKLRRHYEYYYDWHGIRQYSAGEYGSKSGRPHYHLLLFNCPIFDLQLHHRNFEGSPLYTSETLSKLWPHGFVIVGELTFKSAAYVSRYVLKKQKGKQAKDFYEQFDILPEFNTCSTNPYGIGYGYYLDHKEEIYEDDHVTLFNGEKVIQLPPPKYFDGKFKIENPELYNDIRQRRMERAAAKTAAQYKENVYFDAFHKLQLEKAQREFNLKALLRTAI